VFAARVRKRARSRTTSTIAGEAIERNEADEAFSAACWLLKTIIPYLSTQ